MLSWFRLTLEVSRDERSKLLQSNDRPLIREYGIAILDTRDIGGCTDEKSLRQLVSTRHYSTQRLERPKPPGRVPIRKCIFTHTNQADLDKLPSIIAQSLRIEDIKAAPPLTCFQDIAIVGHSGSRLEPESSIDRTQYRRFNRWTCK